MAPRWESQAARDAEASNYGGHSYWQTLDESAKRHRDYWLARGDLGQAKRLMTRTLSEALYGNEGE